MSVRLLPFVCAIAIAVGGCGGSGGLSSSSSVDSGAERAALMKKFASAANIPSAKRLPIVNCLITGLEAHGITTHGALTSASGASELRTLSASCTETVLAAGSSTTGATGKVGKGY